MGPAWLRRRLSRAFSFAAAPLAALSAFAAVFLSPHTTRPLTIAAVVMGATFAVVQLLNRPLLAGKLATAPAGPGVSAGGPPPLPTPPRRTVTQVSGYVVPQTLPPPPLLIGRAGEITEITEFLDGATTTGPRVVLIHGTAGIGKTALAVRLAHQVAPRYGGGVLFASLTGMRATEKRTHAILREFVQALQVAEEPVPADTALRDRFAELTSNRRPPVLVVLDDVPDAAVLPPLLPAGRDCAVLVTSRIRCRLAGPGPVREVRLDPLGPEEATQVLRAIVGDERVSHEQAAVSAIVAGAEGYPLALQLAAGSLASRRDWALQAAIQGSSTAGPSAGELDLSYGMLTTEERRTLVQLGLLHDQTFAPWMLAALLGDRDERNAWRVCDRLMHARLLEHVTDDATGVTAFRVLDRVWEYAKLRLATDVLGEVQAEAEARLRAAIESRGRDAPLVILRERVYPGLEGGFPLRAQNHARGALARARERRGVEGALEAEGLALAALAEVATELAAEDAAEMAHQALATHSEAARPRALRSLGKLERRAGRLDSARELLDQARAAAVALHDSDEQARAWRELATVYAAEGRTEEGLDAVEHASALADLTPNSDTRLRASILWAQAVVLLEAADRTGDPGRLLDAERCLVRADRHAATHEQRLWTAWIGYLRARAACQAHRYERGRTLASRAIEQFAGMRHRYGRARCRLVVGQSYLAQHRALEALPVLEDALGTFQTCADRRMEAETATSMSATYAMLARATQRKARERTDAATEAIRLALLAADLYRELGDGAGRWQALRRLRGLDEQSLVRIGGRAG